ncbi:hypothetical protein PLICRDRAFT_65078, partial [Plicaturopsis crispa FD-325 SS-3]
WLRPERQDLIRSIFRERIPQWTHGPRDFQIEAWGHILNGTPLLAVVATGGGKTALYYGPIIIYHYLFHHPSLLDVAAQRILPRKPVAIVVSPLIELGNSQVSAM